MADLVRIPCRIGDTVWTIRNYKGVKTPKKGIVGELVFTPTMELVIVVHHIARGRWGEAVFGSKAEALKALMEEKPVYKQGG